MDQASEVETLKAFVCRPNIGVEVLWWKRQVDDLSFRTVWGYFYLMLFDDFVVHRCYSWIMGHDVPDDMMYLVGETLLLSYSYSEPIV